MDFRAFNQLNQEDAFNLLKHCAHLPTWINQLINQRPFSTQNTFFEQAHTLALAWKWEEILTALNQHPRIGEKKANQTLSKQEQHYSHQEQANIQLDHDMQNQLIQKNIEYEQMFGFIFLIRAAGRSQNEILSALDDRLNNPIEVEKNIVKQQLIEIAMLRLKQEITT